MRVHNVHRRAIARPEVVAELLDGLAGPDDQLWPRRRWPPLELDRPLQPGARGGHGPIRYRVDQYEPGRRVRFVFERPRGLDGTHEFQLLQGGGRPAELLHLVDVRLTGWSRLWWPLALGPLHDALLEDALDDAQRVAGELRRPARWSRRVRVLRRLLALAAHPPGARGHRPVR